MDTQLSFRLLGESQSEADKCYHWQFKEFFVLTEFLKNEDMLKNCKTR